MLEIAHHVSEWLANSWSIFVCLKSRCYTGEIFYLLCWRERFEVTCPIGIVESFYFYLSCSGKGVCGEDCKEAYESEKMFHVW